MFKKWIILKRFKLPNVTQIKFRDLFVQRDFDVSNSCFLPSFGNAVIFPHYYSKV